MKNPKTVLWSHMLQDFVHHFHVLLHRDTSPTKSGIRDFFRRIHLPPAGYQVGNTMVRSLETLHSPLLVQQHLMFEMTAEGNCVWRRCSCGRQSVSVFRPSCTRKSCGELSTCSAASEPSWRGSTLLTWGEPPVSSRWDFVVLHKLVWVIGMDLTRHKKKHIRAIRWHKKHIKASLISPLKSCSCWPLTSQLAAVTHRWDLDQVMGGVTGDEPTSDETFKAESSAKHCFSAGCQVALWGQQVTECVV